jgi:NAD(P)-dependent dehydrogenase (short-subunit alcohol dehydrogenase family)
MGRHMIKEPVVIVTGASRGLGAATARWLAQVGAAVTLVARSEKMLEKVSGDVDRLGGRPLRITADVTDPDACCNAVKMTLNKFGKIDALVNNAGTVQPIATIAQTDPSSWRYNIEVNLLGPFYLVHYAVSELRKQNGRIVNVSSGAANLALETISAYCTGKAALNHFTRVLAEEEPRVTTMTVRPGVVDTDMQGYIREAGRNAMSVEQIDYYQNLKDNGVLEPPDVPARSIAWLALYAPREFSGRFLDYDDPSVSRPAKEFFGESLE